MSLEDDLEMAAAPIDKLWSAANAVQQMIDRIKDAVGAPFRPQWADPLQAAKELFAENGSLLRSAGREITRLRQENAVLRKEISELETAKSASAAGAARSR